jgi:hypothetical protein
MIDSGFKRESTLPVEPWGSIAAAMGVTIEIGLPGQTKSDALAVPVARAPHGLGGEGGRIVDEKLQGRLARLTASGELRGDPGEAVVLHLDGELETPRVVAVGIGDSDRVDLDTLRTAGAAAAHALARVGGTVAGCSTNRSRSPSRTRRARSSRG